MSDWWRGAVIYQIYPRSFKDTTGNGVGDLKGITQNLDYVASLGVEGIWISPFFTSPMKDFGYDISDYCDVDPLFGTIADFDELIKKAHSLGLKIIIDQVLSHTSNAHPWFLESRSNKDNPKADWYVWADARHDGTPPNNWLSIFGGSAWEWEPRRGQYYLHNFLKEQPDLNWHHHDVQTAMLDTMRFWLDRGVDGFRLDAINFIMHDQLLRDNPARTVVKDVEGVPLNNPYARQLHKYDKSQPEAIGILNKIRALMEEYPGTTTVGEVGCDNSLERACQYVKGKDRLHMAYTFNLLSERFSSSWIKDVIRHAEEQVDDGWLGWSFNNHDVARAISRLNPLGKYEDNFARLLLVILSCLRGTVYLYQGEELGLDEAEIDLKDRVDPYGITFYPDFKGRDGCRTPIPWKKDLPNAGFTTGKSWLPLGKGHHLKAVDQQHSNHASLLNFYRQWLALRKLYPALVRGKIALVDASAPVLIFDRTLDDQTVRVIANCSSQPVTVGKMQGHLLDVRLMKAETEGGQLALPPYGWSCFELERG